MSKVINKKLHPYYKTGIYGWLGEEVDDNDYILCPICCEVLGMNYWDYQAENDGDNKCPKCKQELDYSEIYDFEDTLYFRQLLEIKESRLADLEAKLAESENRFLEHKRVDCDTIQEQSDLIEKLKQQLAEKDEEIYDKNFKISKLNCDIECFNRMLTQSDALVISKEQDKISFCVEQLELLKNCKIVVPNMLSIKDTNFYVSIQTIDNQIKQLKEHK